MIIGREQPDEGQVSTDRGITIGYFSQDVGEMSGRSAVAEVMDGAGPVSEVAAELKELEAAMADPDRADEMDEIVTRYGEVQARFEELDGYALDGRAREVLAGLAFSQEMMDGDVGALSGGWKMRVALARVSAHAAGRRCCSTSRATISTSKASSGSNTSSRAMKALLLMTSHDREFMNRIVDQDRRDRRRIAHHLFRAITTSTSSSGRSHEKQQQAQFERQQAMLAKEIRFIERFKARASHAAQVQSRVKQLAKIDRVEPPKRRQTIMFDFPVPPRSGEDVVSMKAVHKGYGSKRIYDGLDFHVRRKERWCVMGVNGAGKSTLLKLIAGSTEPDAGTCHRGRQREDGLLRAARDGSAGR